MKSISDISLAQGSFNSCNTTLEDYHFTSKPGHTPQEKLRRAKIVQHMKETIGEKMPELELDLWLRPEDVKPESTLVFLNVGETGKIAGKEGEADTETFEIDVELPSGETRKWTMNKTSQRAIAQIYGINTDAWKGKTVEVYVSKQNVRGAEKEVIYARVPKMEPQAPV